MDKKGFLLAEETLKIIIALIGISFLVLFLTSLYFTNIKQQKLEQANQELKNSEESIQNIIKRVGEEREKNIISPVGWFLLSFTGKVTPDSCTGPNCICICEGVSDNFIINYWEEWEKRQAKQCTESGSCLGVASLSSFDRIEIKNPKEKLTKIIIKKGAGKISITEKIE